MLNSNFSFFFKLIIFAIPRNNFCVARHREHLSKVWFGCKRVTSVEEGKWFAIVGKIPSAPNDHKMTLNATRSVTNHIYVLHCTSTIESQILFFVFSLIVQWQKLKISRITYYVSEDHWEENSGQV